MGLIPNKISIVIKMNSGSINSCAGQSSHVLAALMLYAFKIKFVIMAPIRISNTYLTELHISMAVIDGRYA